MIPISDDNPTLHTPIMTWLLLGAMFAVWFVVQGGGYRSVRARHQRLQLRNGAGRADPPRARSGPPFRSVPVSPASSTTSRSTSSRRSPRCSCTAGGGTSSATRCSSGSSATTSKTAWARGVSSSFYLLCGLVAAAAHVLLSPTSPVPTVGASGAISGVLGAYLVLYPRVRVNMLFIFVIFFRVFAIPAWAVLLWWFGVQVITAYLTPVRPDISGGVAVWAHIGGFVAGVMLVKVFENPALVARRNQWRRDHAFNPAVID